MELSKQVVSLELAQKLKELGVKQESVFVWWKQEGEFRAFFNPAHPKTEVFGEVYSAFTVAELGEMLPANPTIDGKMYQLESCKHGKWDVKYVYYENGIGTLLGGYPKVAIADTEADARAEMLVYLLENGLLTY